VCPTRLKLIYRSRNWRGMNLAGELEDHFRAQRRGGRCWRGGATGKNLPGIVDERRLNVSAPPQHDCIQRVNGMRPSMRPDVNDARVAACDFAQVFAGGDTAMRERCEFRERIPAFAENRQRNLCADQNPRQALLVRGKDQFVDEPLGWEMIG